MRAMVMIALAVAALAGTPLSAQLLPTSDPGRAVRTRADLERLLEEYEAALASSAYSESVKQSVRADAERVRERLTEGDFRVGDRVYVAIQGEANYPDTVLVEAGPVVSLQPFGDISLAGVLRSELRDHLTRELGRFIRDPQVQAQGLLRVAVLGGVARPGFYTMPGETILGDMLMMAGGPAPNADLEDLRIERAGQRVYEDAEVQEALRAGLTLDQLNLEAGDQVFVPTRSSTNFLGTVVPIVGAVGTLAYLLVRFIG